MIRKLLKMRIGQMEDTLADYKGWKYWVGKHRQGRESFLYARIELGISITELKINILKALAGVQ